MSKFKLHSIEDVQQEDIIKEEIQFQYFWYLLVLFSIYLISFIIPSILFMSYIFLFFLPYFLEIRHFFSLFNELKSFISLISMPLIIILCYLIRLFFVALITRGFWKLSEKKSPSKSGIIPRNFPSKTLNYYHIRGFMIKYGKGLFTKGIFPWLSNWLFNFVGSNEIGKGSTLEESVGNDKFSIVGANCYIGVNSTLASHLVEGVFGNIAYFQIKLGDNITTAAMNQIGPGSELHDNSWLLPLASATKHSILKGNNYYWGIPLRKIFRKKIMKYLNLTPKELEINENIEGYKDKKLVKQLKEKQKLTEKRAKNVNNYQPLNEKLEENFKVNNLSEKDLALDFTTSSAISRINIKFLIIYIPIFWLSGMLTTILFYIYTYYAKNLLIFVFFLPAMIIFMWFIFILGCFIFSKLFLTLINLIHRPKEGIFKAEIGDTDFEFWCLRTELKKIVLWLMRTWPIPWMDILAFKWFGIKMSLSSSLYDSWCDGEFITFGRRVLIGQGSTIMSSMIIGKYLIIRKVICGDYSLVGGHSTIAPGTILGEDTFVSAISNTLYNQILEPGWIYMGIPVIKFKPNKYTQIRKETIMKKDVDEEKKFEVDQAINVEKDKKDLI